ncbi:Serine/threonine-protein kinase mph1 [Geodia barretti]|uniref:Serine/threonine-protein kinase mph1 n=1 Tax=Geodia barretti TaxID=519541 RepID=A0AA35TJG6_GEOBA|nr:Serine/threonine-protein kinase mph1 [Geodia barretti]
MAVLQPSSRYNVAVVSEKAGFSGPWGRIRRSSKTSLLDLGPPLRVLVGEEAEEDEGTSIQCFTEPQRSPLAKSRPKNAQNGRGEEGSAGKMKRNTSVPDLHSDISHQRKMRPRSVVPQLNPLLVADVTSSRPPATHHPPPLPPSTSHHAPTSHHSHSQASSVEHSQQDLPSSQPHLPAPQPPATHPLPTSHHPPPPPYSSAVTNQIHPPAFFRPPKKEEMIVMEERKYLKLGLLGRGGSSKVFKVVNEDFEIFALKEVYLKHLDEAVKRAYATEMNFLKLLRNVPEVATLHSRSWDKEEGVLSLLLEYGETDLAAIIRDIGPSLPTASYFWGHMLRILKIIHGHDIIHNDLKPDNFICVRGRLKLIDFGIANRIEDEHTSVHRDLCCGTISYMSPETIETSEDNTFFKVSAQTHSLRLCASLLYVVVSVDFFCPQELVTNTKFYFLGDFLFL